MNSLITSKKIGLSPNGRGFEQPYLTHKFNQTGASFGLKDSIGLQTMNRRKESATLTITPQSFLALKFTVRSDIKDIFPQQQPNKYNQDPKYAERHKVSKYVYTGNVRVQGPGVKKPI